MVLLHEAGASTRLIARRETLDFNPQERWPRPLFERVCQPMTGVGPGWKNLLTTDLLPWIYPYLPDSYKLRSTRQTLGPAAGWFMKDRARDVPMLLGRHLVDATEREGKVRLVLSSEAAGREMINVEHVIAATGYRTAVRRLDFLSPDIIGQLALVADAPSLSAGFEASLAGLYLAGPVSAPSSGPVMRFSLRAGFTARRIMRSLRPAAMAA